MPNRKVYSKKKSTNEWQEIESFFNIFIIPKQIDEDYLDSQDEEAYFISSNLMPGCLDYYLNILNIRRQNI